MRPLRKEIKACSILHTIGFPELQNRISLQNNNASGLDGISAGIFNSTFHVIAPYLLDW